MEARAKQARFLLGLLFVLGLTLLQGALWLKVTPVWGAPDEPGHFLYVKLYAELKRPPRPEDITPADREALFASMRSLGWQNYVRPEEEPVPLEQDPTLMASGLQIGQKPPGYYALAAQWLRWHPHWREMSLVDQVIWLRWLSLWLRLSTLIIVMALAMRLWPENPQRTLALGLLVGLHPMAGFIGSSVNNDAFTMFWGSAVFAGLMLANSLPGWTLTLGLTLFGPLVIDTGLLFLWPLLAIRIVFFTNQRGALRLRSRHALRSPILLAIALAMLLFITLLLLPNPKWAAGWRRVEVAESRANGQLHLIATEKPTRLHQTISGLRILQRQGRPLTLMAEVFGKGEYVQLRLIEEGKQKELACPLNTQPQTCRITHVLSDQAHHVTVQVILPEGEAFMKIRLTDDQGWSLLVNGDGAWPAPLGDPLFTWLEKRLPLPAGYFSRLFLDNVWDVPSLFRYLLYMGFAWASFWGWFGWLTRPYPWLVYILLGFLTLLAGWGLWKQHLQRALSASIGLAGIATGLIGMQIFLPMMGQAWQPQGRYLFPALLPIAILLLWGWEAWCAQHDVSKQRLWLLFTILVGLNLLGWWIVYV